MYSLSLLDLNKWNSDLTNIEESEKKHSETTKTKYLNVNKDAIKCRESRKRVGIHFDNEFIFIFLSEIANLAPSCVIYEFSKHSDEWNSHYNRHLDWGHEHSARGGA